MLRKLSLEPLEERSLLTADILPNNSIADAQGVYNRTTSTFQLATPDFGGSAIVVPYGAPGAGWLPLGGDWNADGFGTIGMYDPATSVFYLRNTNNSGSSDVAFAYGAPGWLPIVGDWNADMTDSIGLYDPATSTFYLSDTLGAPTANIVFGFGVPNAGWLPIAGDWEGNGRTSVGLYDPVNSVFYLTNSTSGGFAEFAFGYGVPGAGWLPVAGDWSAHRVSNIGLYDPATCVFYLADTTPASTAHQAAVFLGARPGELPVTANWDGVILSSASQSLTADSHAELSASEQPAIDADLLRALTDAAIADWRQVGLSEDLLQRLDDVLVTVADLPGAQLGLLDDRTIYIDRDAAGHGWFVDPTPDSDTEFVPSNGGLHALDAAAVDRIDLLSVLSHELGHALGRSHDDSATSSLMSASLSIGIRRLPAV